MTGNAAVVNVFSKPYEVWSYRKTTMEEALNLHRNEGISLVSCFEVKDKLKETISTHIQAATRILINAVDSAMESHIDNALTTSTEFHELLAFMPTEMPEALSIYQSEFTDDCLALANKAINNHGIVLAEGQYLFHGGHWQNENITFRTSRPFSTSFCPQIALRNAEWGGKAYDAERVDLMVVCVKNPKTKAFIYREESSHGHEKEVVFASGAQLTLINQTHIADITAYKVTNNLQEKKKTVPAYLLQVQIS